MKRNYQKPTIQVVKLQQQCAILEVSNGGVNSVNGNVFNSSISGGNGSARSRSFDGWDDDE